MTDVALARAAGVSVAGGPVAAKPLEVALQLLELKWQTFVGEGGGPDADDDEPPGAGSRSGAGGGLPGRRDGERSERTAAGCAAHHRR
eukprot:1600326-Pleurochrysis_carterae.AAC.1